MVFRDEEGYQDSENISWKSTGPICSVFFSLTARLPMRARRGLSELFISLVLGEYLFEGINSIEEVEPLGAVEDRCIQRNSTVERERSERMSKSIIAATNLITWSGFIDGRHCGKVVRAQVDSLMGFVGYLSVPWLSSLP